GQIELRETVEEVVPDGLALAGRNVVQRALQCLGQPSKRRIEHDLASPGCNQAEAEVAYQSSRNQHQNWKFSKSSDHPVHTSPVDRQASLSLWHELDLPGHDSGATYFI